MYQQGEMVFYGNSGVCRVASVGKPSFPVEDKNRLYYKLSPAYSTETIWTPVDTKVFMRPVLTKDEVEMLIRQMPAIHGDMGEGQNFVLLSARYQEAFQTHSNQELICLIKTIYGKARRAEQGGRKMGQIDRHFMIRAEDILFGEFAVALGIPRDEVKPYIEKRIREIESEAKAN